MEMNNDLKVFHRRSSAGCIVGGYRLYTSIFRRLLRSSWPMAVVYALAMALMSGYFINRVIRLTGIDSVVAPDAAKQQLTGTMTVWGLLVLLFLVCAAVLASYGFSALREHQATGEVVRSKHWYGSFDSAMLGRVALTALWLLVAVLIAGGLATGLFMLASQTGLTTLYVAVGVFSLLVVFAMLPLSYTVYKSVLAERFVPYPPLKGYLNGLGHFGMLLVVIIVTFLITLLLTLIIQLPALILYTANIQAQLGLSRGDELGIPEGIQRLSLVVFFIAGFIQGYVHLSTLFPLYYAYGTIVQEERERVEMQSAEHPHQASEL